MAARADVFLEKNGIVVIEAVSRLGDWATGRPGDRENMTDVKHFTGEWHLEGMEAQRSRARAPACLSPEADRMSVLRKLVASQTTQ